MSERLTDAQLAIMAAAGRSRRGLYLPHSHALVALMARELQARRALLTAEDVEALRRLRAALDRDMQRIMRQPGVDPMYVREPHVLSVLDKLTKEHGK